MFLNTIASYTISQYLISVAFCERRGDETIQQGNDHMEIKFHKKKHFIASAS